MSKRLWTHQTAQKIADILDSERDIKVSATVVRHLLYQMNYSLKSNKKCLTSGNSPDRDSQFGIIKELREEFTRTDDPIISIDTKKKELIGLFKNSGKIWCQQASKVKDHDFRSEADGIAVPYGIYDTVKNSGLLVVGESADTPEFAVNCILTWWQQCGREQYPNAKRLLILADGGGSNGHRCRAWKKFLHEKFAQKVGLTVTVAHYPTGTSKWNPIEHRMFSQISRNWKGIPLTSFNTVVDYASGTSTRTGLHITACRDEHTYQKGIKVKDHEMKSIPMIRNDLLGKWNYTITSAEQNACV